MQVVSTATVIAVEWTLLGLCLFLILARLHLRLHLEHKKPILSDYLTCLAFLTGVCEAALDIKLMKLGWLSPSTTWAEFESNANSPASTQKFVFIGWFPFLTTFYLTKAAIISFLFYIFPSTLRWIYYSLWAISIYSGLSYVTSILLVFLSCLPHKRVSFTFSFCGAHSQFILWIVSWALHFSSDIFIFILPLFVLRTLRLDWKKKLGLYATFGFGVFSISACLVRFLIVLLTYPNVPTTNIELWCALDSYVGLLVACLPPLRPYLNLKRASLKRTTPSDSCRRSVLDKSSASDCPLTKPSEIYSWEGHIRRDDEGSSCLVR